MSTEFDRYILEHPELAEKIPQNAQVIFLPEDDPELCKVNKKISRQQQDEGQQIVYVHIGTIASQISRLTDVSLEVEVA